MSHLIHAPIQITSLDDLRTAAEACGLEYDPTATSFRWFDGSRSACVAALRVPGNPRAHEVGVVKTPKGYGLQYDPWQGGYGLEAKAGADLDKLRDEYTTAVSTRQMMRQGYRVQRTVNATGQIRLVCSK